MTFFIGGIVGLICGMGLIAFIDPNRPRTARVLRSAVKQRRRAVEELAAVYVMQGSKYNDAMQKASQELHAEFLEAQKALRTPGPCVNDLA